ncbi:MAG: PAS domain S-box protein [Bacteroidota bacterium]
MFKFSGKSIQEVLNSIHDALFIHDGETGSIVFVNQRMCELYNCTVGQALGISPDATSLGTSPYSKKEAYEWLQKAIHEGEQQFEWIARKFTGETFWTEVVLRSTEIENKKYIISVVRDITERKNAELEKQKTVSQLNAILDSSTTAIGIIDYNGVFKGGNKALLLRWGKTKEEMIGRSAREILPPEIFESRLKKVRDVIHSKKGISFVDGFNEHWFEVSISPVVEPDDRVLSVSMFSQDITEKKLADLKLQEERDNVVSVLESMSDAFVSIDKNWCFAYMNPLAGKIFNCDPLEIIGTKIQKLFPKKEGRFFLIHYKKAVREQKPVNIEEFYPPLNKWFENRIFPAKNGLTIFFQDITQRKNAEIALRESEERFRILIEQAADGIYLGDTVGNFIGVNSIGVEITGYSREELLTMNMGDLFTEEEKKRTPLRYDLLIAGNVIINERALLRKDGSTRFVEMHTKMMPDKTYQSIFRDITERKKAEAAMKESEAYYRTIFENTGTATVIIEEDTVISLANSKFEELSGYKKEEIEGKLSWTFFVVKDDLERMTEMHKKRRAENSDIPKSYEFRFSDKSGHIKNILLSIDIIAGTKRSVASLLDITDRKQSEKALSDAANQWKSTFDAVSDGVSILDNNQNILLCNKAMYDLFQKNEEEIIGRKCWEVVHGTELPITECPVKRMRISKLRESMELKLHDRWLDVTIDPVFDSKNNITAAVHIVRDITERKKAERDLVESEEKYRTLIESATDSIMIIQNGIIKFVNKILVDISGYSLIDLIGQPFINFVVERDRPLIKDYYTQRLNGINAPVGYEARAIMKNGKEIPIEISASVFNFLGEKAELVFLRDITERKEIEARIIKINEELEERVQQRTKQLEDANKELEAFSYSVSHDLRAPLRAISGFTKILSEDYAEKIENDGQRICNVILNETQRMGQLIDDLLTFSRLSRTAMQSEPVDMKKLAQHAFKEISDQNKEMKIEFILSDIPSVRADSALLRQVWVNLISNAVKFSSKKESSRIEVGFYEEKNETIFFVKDNGAGFDMKYADKLFGVFQRLHALSEFQGTGVGLAIVQRIIHRHNGRVWAEGVTGKGAIFYFSLPK